MFHEDPLRTSALSEVFSSLVSATSVTERERVSNGTYVPSERTSPIPLFEFEFVLVFVFITYHTP